ncbi:MAG: hypothetical protein HS116_20145 [Planctomycetes bacterium]|nr:hypothetical protein [Planctomycetota bacterium]
MAEPPAISRVEDWVGKVVGNEMRKFEYKLAEQRGKIGYFARVALFAGWTRDSGQLELDFNANCGDVRWKTGVLFGVEYFWEKEVAGLMHERGLEIKIHEIDGQPVDTTVLVVAYVTIHALRGAVGTDSRYSPEFDGEKGGFYFPK